MEEHNPRLKAAILETVENQLQSDDPPETRQTLERLKRAGFSDEEIAPLKKAYVLLYRSGLKLDEALARIEVEAPSEHTAHLVRFIRSSERGIAREQNTSGLREH